jgi:hypothetical protein
VDDDREALMLRLRSTTTATGTALAGMLFIAAAAGPAGAAARADDTPPEFVSVEVVTPAVNVGTGFGEVIVDVHFRDAEGLPDTMGPIAADNPEAVSAGRAVILPGAGAIGWRTLGRISGTRQDGVWRGSARLSPAWSGTYTINQVQADDASNGTFFFPVANGPSLTVTGGQSWFVTTIRTPMAVVTGNELWRPRARVTNAATGAPIGGARVLLTTVFEPWLDWAWRGTAPGTAADAAGVWVSPTTQRFGDYRGEQRALTYGSRGSRGWSMQGVGCVDLTVKLQASATYSAAALRLGQQLVVTGNVWPAPSIFPVGTPIALQRDMGAAGWHNVASANPRSNGRYTLAWQPPTTGSYSLRVRWPGGGSTDQCKEQTVGTTLAATRLTVS